MNAHLDSALRRVQKTGQNLKVHDGFSGQNQVQSKTPYPKTWFWAFGTAEGHSKGQN